MAKPVAFSGTLSQNAVLAAMYNMIQGQEVFSKNISIKGTLVEKFRLDGTLYGDTKLFISTDVGTITDFPNTANTLLTKMNPKDPKTQAVKVDTFKQTGITIDGVKLKQAFMSADIYGAFVSVTVQWLRDAMKVLNMTLINTFIGTIITEAEKNVIEIDFREDADYDSLNLQQKKSYQAEVIGEALANVAIDLKDALRTYNDYSFLRAYDLSDFMIVWNKTWSNRIRHISLPQIFHKDGVIDGSMDKEVINNRYFGNVLATGGTSDGTVRTMIDKVINVGGQPHQLFPGDLIPNGVTYGANEAFEQDDTIIGKIVHKRAVPFMSALVVQTEFYNPKDLDRNHYLTWGYSEPTYLKEFPIIVFKDNTDYGA